MRISACDQIPGTVKKVTEGPVLAEVTAMIAVED
jgi:molybdopterin-binding protein